MNLGRLVVAIAVVGSALPVLPGPAQAASITVTTSADVVAADGLTSLREAVQTARSNGTDDVIVLDGATTYTLSDCALGALLHDESADLVIEGNGATIAQTCVDESILTKDDLTDQVLEIVDVTLVTGPLSGGSRGGCGCRCDKPAGARHGHYR